MKLNFPFFAVGGSFLVFFATGYVFFTAGEVKGGFHIFRHGVKIISFWFLELFATELVVCSIFKAMSDNLQTLLGIINVYANAAKLATTSPRQICRWQTDGVTWGFYNVGFTPNKRKTNKNISKTGKSEQIKIEKQIFNLINIRLLLGCI